MRVLTDPRLFNYVIMGLYALNAARWALEGKPGLTSAIGCRRSALR
jgi:hypothetical protein